MKCPKCGSSSVKCEIRAAGTTVKSHYYRTGVKSSWFIPAGTKTYRSKRKHKTVALCQNCGCCFNPDTVDAKKCLFYVLCFMFFPISLSVWFYRTPRVKLNKIWRVAIIVAFWVLIYVIDWALGHWA